MGTAGVCPLEGCDKEGTQNQEVVAAIALRQAQGHESFKELLCAKYD